MNRPTVFHVNGERGLRGGERQLLLLARELDRKGYRDVVACRAGSALEAEARRAGLEILNLPFMTELDPVSAWKLRQSALASERPLLHAHTSHAAAIAYLAASSADLPRVSHRRVSFDPGRWGFAIKYKSAGAVVAVSEFVRSQLVNAGLPERQAFVVPDACSPGPKPDSASRAALRSRLAESAGAAADGFWIGQLAALTAEKDQATLLRAFARLAKTRQDAWLLLAGDGPLEAPLRALSKELGVEARTRFLGYRPNAAEILPCFDLYVQSSVGEGLGSAVLEAMACGVPAVAARTGGLPELVIDGETGWLAAPGDPASLSEAIERALASPEQRALRSKAALLRMPDYAVERIADKIERVYDYALSGRQAAPAR